MQCPQCGSSQLARSQARGLFENGLFLFGAEIRRCLACNSRGALLETRAIPLRRIEDAPEPDVMRVWPLYAVAGGVLTCVAIGVWVLARFHRL